MRKILIVFLAVMLAVGMCGCGKEEQPKEWTYQLLEEELGGIIEVNYNELKDCLKILSNETHYVNGYAQDVSSTNAFGMTLYSFELSDNKDVSQYENTLYVACDENNINKVADGDFVYVKGTFLAKVEYTKNDYSYQISSEGDTISDEKSGEEYLSVRDFYNLMDKIYDDTFFKVTGLIIKDADRYYLYQSEEAYKESKYNRIDIEFSEEQNNLNGKNVTIIGKADTFLNVGTGLIDCSIAD